MSIGKKMAKDHHIKGFNTSRMAVEADRYREMFGVSNAEQVDILDILEFRLKEFYPGFRLVIKRDCDLRDNALADIPNNRILVRESIYMSAYEGEAESRFILAHELGHYLLHSEKNTIMHNTRDGIYEGISGLNSSESTESQADMFARHFLVPLRLAYQHRDDSKRLARISGTTPKLAKGSVTISKRPEMRKFVTPSSVSITRVPEVAKNTNKADQFSLFSE